MGNANAMTLNLSEKPKNKVCQQIPPEYQVLSTKFNKKTHEQITILHNANSKQVYYLKKLNFLDKDVFRSSFNKIHLQSSPQSNKKQYILSCIRIWSQQLTSLCNNNYRIYAIYEYSQLTLRQEIKMRKIQRRKFQASDLWAILQCCIHAIQFLPHFFTFEPQKIFILAQGRIKVINQEILNQFDQHRFVIDQNTYYAPQKISNFDNDFEQNGSIKAYEKQIIFSLGLSLIEAGTFQDVRKCYNFQEQQFNKPILQQIIEQMRRTYQKQDIRLYQTIRGMVQLEPNRRFSLENLQEVLYIKQKIEKSIMIGKQIDSRTTFDNNLISKYSPKYLPKQSHKRSISSNSYAHQSIDSESFNRIFKNSINMSKTSQDYQQTQKKKYTNAKMSFKQLVQPNSESFYVYQNQKNSRFPNFQSIILQNSAQLHQEDSSKTLQPYLPNIPKILYKSLDKNKEKSFISSSINSVQYNERQNIQIPIMKQALINEQNKKSYYRLQYNKQSVKQNTKNEFEKAQEIYQIYPSSEDKVKSQSFLMSQHSAGSLFNLTAQNSLTHTKKNEHLNFPKNLANYTPEKCFTFKDITLATAVIDYSNVRYYEGSLRNGMRQGVGRLIFLDKKVYEGQFKDNEIDGYGIFYEMNQQAIYEGYWKKNQFEGQGILNNLTVKQLDLNKPIDHRNLNSLEVREHWLRYEGSFISGIRHGKGYLIFANGQSFQGQFQKGVPQGKGKFRNLYGQYIIGTWSSGYYFSNANCENNQ